ERRKEASLLDASVIGIYDSLTDSYSAYVEEEFPKLWPILDTADLLIGFNSEHFDIPLLAKYYPGNLGRIKSVDLMKEVKASIGRRVKLDQIAEGTLGKNKTGHGLDAVTWWKRGEYEKVKAYCVEDVKITKELYDFALRNNLLKFKEDNKVMDIKLNTTGWETLAEKVVTKSLF
ncbi:ribonuclease H-like domain-containing protein, partial [Candidatus Parcubacteria bacterium]|nr:ribonuclease H-like domain-containing protein [Candidatus Parcubacteria bacterium]